MSETNMNASVDAESTGEEQLITTLDLSDTTKTDISVVNEETAPDQETPPSETKVSIAPDDSVYYHTFQDGATGMGLDDVPGGSVGIVVSVIAEGSQAYDSGCIRVGDTVEAVGDTDVSSLNMEMVSDLIQNATRPLTLKFRSAPYHVQDKSKEEAILKIWNEILQSGAENLNANALIDALQPINIILSEESAGVLIEQVEEDFTDENLNYEDFLQGAYRIYMDAQAGQTEQDAGLEQTQQDAPVEETQEDPPVEETQEDVLVEKTQEDPPVEETQYDPPVEETQEDPPVEETQEDPPVEETQEDPPVEENSLEQSLDQNLQDTDATSLEQDDGETTNNKSNRIQKPKPRIILLAPPHTYLPDFTTKIADDYGVIPLAIHTILASCIESGTQDGYEVKQCLENNRNVPDELKIKLVVERLKQSDVSSCGYVLSDFPANRMQANALFDAKIQVDRVVVFDVEDDIITKRLKNRRLMPNTGETKSLGFNLSMDDAEESVPVEDNEEDILPDKIDAYLSNLENIEELIGDKGVDSEGNMLFDVLHIDANGNTFDDVWANVKAAVGAPPAEDEAAAKIQAIIRGKQERALQREREEAAKKIQAISRGRAVRKETANRKELNKQVRFDKLISALVAAATSEAVGAQLGDLFPSEETRDIPMKDFIGKIKRWKEDPVPDLIENLKEQMLNGEETSTVLSQDFPRLDGKGKRVMNYMEFVNCIQLHGGDMAKQRRKEIQERRRRATVMEFSKRKEDFAAMFAQLDLDGDGQLSMEEFHAGFAAKSREWGYEGSMDAADSAEMEMFRAMDADSSGYISYDEFKSYMDSLVDNLLQENKDMANEKYQVARENDRARERAAAMEYSMKVNENYEVADPASEDGVYTRYNIPAVVVANAGTQKTYENPKATQSVSTGTSMDDDGPLSWNQFDSNLGMSGGTNGFATSILNGTQQEAENEKIMNTLDEEETLFRDDAALLAKIIRRYRPGLKYVFDFYSRTNAGNTAMRATRGVATFEAIAVEHSGVSRIMFRRFCADFNLLREDGAKARRLRRKVDDLCLTPEECMAIFDQHARKLKIVSSVSRGKGVLFQNEFAACLAQLADTLMEPYSITYPKTWRRVHAIFGRLDFGNILELRKRLKGKTGFGVGDGEPTGHGSSKEFAYKQGFSYELQPRDWPNAPLTPLPKKTSRISGSSGFEDPIMVNERNTMRLQIAEEFEQDMLDFGDIDKVKQELYGVQRGSNENADKDRKFSFSTKLTSGADNPDEVNSFLDDLGLTYGLEHKTLMQSKSKKNQNVPRRRRAKGVQNRTRVVKGTVQRSPKATSGKQRQKPIPPKRGKVSPMRSQRVSPKRRFITTQYDTL